MIKKLLTISLITLFGASYAQNIELRIHNQSALINGTNIFIIDTVSTSLSQDVAAEIDVISKYTTAKTIKVRKREVISNAPLQENAICWGLCTLGVTWGTSPVVESDPVPMPVSTSSILYSGHVYPKANGGTSTFRYIWYDVNNPNDSTWVDVTFGVAGTASLNEIERITKLSIYPNPATNLLNIDLNSNEANKSIEIMDLIGRKVYTKIIAGNSELLRVNTSGLTPGIYFVSVVANNKTVRTEKVIITK